MDKRLIFDRDVINYEKARSLYPTEIYYDTVEYFLLNNAENLTKKLKKLDKCKTI